MQEKHDTAFRAKTGFLGQELAGGMHLNVVAKGVTKENKKLWLT